MSSLSPAVYALLAYGFPGVGCVISTCFSLTPLSSLLTVRQTHKLGKMDPFPPVLNMASGVFWLGYAVLSNNPFLFVGGSAALVMGLLAFLTAHSYADTVQRERMDEIVLGLGGLIITTGLVSMIKGDPGVTLGFVGIVANVLVLIVYFSPLKNLLHVVRSKDSSSILLPWSALQCLNNSLWTIYAIVVGDMFVFVSSFLGVVSALAAIALRLAYPAKAPPTPVTVDELGKSMRHLARQLSEAGQSSLQHTMRTTKKHAPVTAIPEGEDNDSLGDSQWDSTAAVVKEEEREKGEGEGGGTTGAGEATPEVTIEEDKADSDSTRAAVSVTEESTGQV